MIGGRRASFLSALGLWAAVAACAGPNQSAEETDQDAAIGRVVEDLRTEVAVVGRPSPERYTLAARMLEHSVPGVSVAVVENHQLVWARGFGVREAGTEDSVSVTTLFQAASISKPIAATGILRLVESGVLDLDRPVNDYLSSWRVPDNALTAQEAVTLRQLISHGAGTTVWGFPGYERGEALPTLPQILDGEPPANTPPVRVDITPGTAWRYSGGGVTISQLAVMDVTSRPYADVLKELVLEPFGLEHSTFVQPLPSELIEEAAAGHTESGVLPGRAHVYPELAAAGLWTTPTDLLRWSAEIARAYRGETGSLLSGDLAREMLSRQHGNTGLGPSMGGVGRSFFFGHGGSNAGFRSQLVYFPETGQGAAVMSNSDGGGYLNREILLALAAEYGWPEYGEVTPVEIDGGEIANYLGEFAASQLPITLELRREDNAFFVEGRGALGRQEVVFLAPDRATSLGTGTEIVFRRDASGSVDAIESMGLVLARQR